MDDETPNEAVRREIEERSHKAQVLVTILGPPEASRPVVDDDQVVRPERQHALPVARVVQVGHPDARAVHVGVRCRFAREVPRVELGKRAVEIVDVEDHHAATKPGLVDLVHVNALASNEAS